MSENAIEQRRIETNRDHILLLDDAKRQDSRWNVALAATAKQSFRFLFIFTRPWCRTFFRTSFRSLRKLVAARCLPDLGADGEFKRRAILRPTCERF